MPRYRVEDALSRLEIYVTDIGDTVEGHDVRDLVSFETGDGERYSLHGHRCRSGEHSYLVAGNERVRFVGVLYTYDIRSAVDEQLPTVDGETREEFEYRLQKLSLGTGCTVEIRDDDEGNLSHTVVGTRVFPYEQNFGVEKFYEARQRILNLGSTVKRAVEQCISLEPGPESPGSVTPTIDPSRI